MAEASKTSGNDAVRAVPWLDIDGPVGAAMAGSSGTPSVPARTQDDAGGGGDPSPSPSPSRSRVWEVGEDQRPKF